MMQLFRATLIVFLTFLILACACMVRVYGLIGDARRDLGSITSQVSTTLAQVNATEQDASTKLAEEQRQVGEAVTASKHILERTDQALFGRDLKSGLFGQARELMASSNQLLLDSDVTVKAQNGSLLETQAQVRTSLFQFSRDSSATLDQSKNLLNQLNQDASDPAIHSTLHHVDATTANIADTTKDLKEVADKFRSDYLKPQKVAWWLVKTLIGLGGSLAQMIK